MKAGLLVNDFDGAVAALRARGVEIIMGPYPPRETVRANLIFKDDSGNYVQVIGPYARK